MLSWLSKRRKAESDAIRVGLFCEARRIGLVACRRELEGRPRIVAWESLAIDDSSELSPAVQRFVAQHGLQGQPCRVSLDPADYSLRLVDRPTNVPEEELVEATRWLIRDLVEFDIEQAELAILTLPADASRGRTPRMFVVAARREPIVQLAEAVDASGLRLEGVDIVETAMLSLEALLPEVVAGSALLHSQGKSSVLTLSLDERLYLARSLSIEGEAVERAALHALDSPYPTDDEVMALLDPLLLEIQRSLDYYESEYGQAPASRLVLLPSSAEMGPLVPVLSEALRPLQVESFELERYLSIDDPPRADAGAALTIAAGSALASCDHEASIGAALVPSAFKSRDGSFGLTSVMRIAVAILLLSSLFFALESFRLSKDRAALARVEKDRQALQSQIERDLEIRLADMAGSDPEAEIEALTALRDARLRVLRDLDGRASTRTTSFSSLLEGLARQDLESIWLERIELDEGGEVLTIEGRTLRAEDLPIFLRGLGHEPSFAKRRFRAFSIEDPEDVMPGLAFRIATNDPAQASSGGDR